MNKLKLCEVLTAKEKREFFKFPAGLYKTNSYYRSSEADIEHLLLSKKSEYRFHSTIRPFLIKQEETVVGRFALIDDSKQISGLMVGFFDAQEGLGDLESLIRERARALYPEKKKIIYGLSAHLNYGAGILLDSFDKSPVFGLPYNHPWYSSYFSGCEELRMVSRNFPCEIFLHFLDRYPLTLPDIRIRFMDKKKLKRDCAIYTELNNRCFQKHPFWADRTEKEDLELFGPFSLFLDKENLIFAETPDGKPVGFLLWYPDFNQLFKSPSEMFSLKHLLKFRLANPITKFRFTEIAVVPEYEHKPVTLMMIQKLSEVIRESPYVEGEAGFIFESNNSSINLLNRFLDRLSVENSIIRNYAVYTKDLSDGK